MSDWTEEITPLRILIVGMILLWISFVTKEYILPDDPPPAPARQVISSQSRPAPDLVAESLAAEEAEISASVKNELRRYARMQATGQLDRIRREAGDRYEGSWPQKREQRWQGLASQYPGLYSQFLERELKNPENMLAASFVQGSANSTTQLYPPEQWEKMVRAREDLLEQKIADTGDPARQKELRAELRRLREDGVMPVY